MKLHKAEIVLLVLALLFMIAVALQTFSTQSRSEPVIVSVETSSDTGTMHTGGNGESAGDGIGL